MNRKAAVLGVRLEDGRAWFDVCDSDGVHSVGLTPGDAIVTGKALLDFGQRMLTASPARHAAGAGVRCRHCGEPIRPSPTGSDSWWHELQATTGRDWDHDAAPAPPC